ncbi:LysR family transcriptional regulator [Halalkalibaculum sp. DA3122]|uniref:LysR family transcriptional regulator n=1 Tax=unclassified Halalkalibaculum TaxID=2964617 RepID=UPI003754364A
MNFNQLNYIIAVDTYRNFTKAAEHCDIAQSTLSKEIQRLEQEFDIVIFDRSRHPVVPTMKGEDLLQQAREILEAKEKFISIARKKDNEPVGSLTLAVQQSLAPYLVPLFIQSLSKKYPGLELFISEVGLQEMEEQFEEGRLDMGIIISPYRRENAYETPLFKEPFVVYLDRNHPLTAHEKIKVSDIPLEETILHEEIRNLFVDSGETGAEISLVKKLKNITYTSGSLETIRKIIDLNGGLTLLPELACMYMGNRRKEMVRRFEPPVPSRTISMVTPRGFQKKRLTKVVRREILNNLPSQLEVFG